MLQSLTLFEIVQAIVERFKKIPKKNCLSFRAPNARTPSATNARSLKNQHRVHRTERVQWLSSCGWLERVQRISRLEPSWLAKHSKSNKVNLREASHALTQCSQTRWIQLESKGTRLRSPINPNRDQFSQYRARRKF